MTQQPVQWRFDRGDAGVDEIRAALQEILAELADPASETAGAARAAGLSEADLAGATVEVREDGPGAESILTAIVVGIAVKAGSTAAETLWRRVIWPRLRQSLGAHGLGEHRDAAPAAE